MVVGLERSWWFKSKRLTLISHIYQNVEQNLRGNLCDEGNTTLFSLKIIITLACAYVNCEANHHWVTQLISVTLVVINRNWSDKKAVAHNKTISQKFPLFYKGNKSLQLPVSVLLVSFATGFRDVTKRPFFWGERCVTYRKTAAKDTRVLWADPFCRPTHKLTALLRSLRNLNFFRRLHLFCVLLKTTKDFRPLLTRNDGNGYETKMLMLGYETKSQILEHNWRSLLRGNER